MRRQLLIALCSFASLWTGSSTLADDTTERVAIRADWKVGDEIHLICDRVREVREGDAAPTGGHSQTPATIRVMEKHEDGYLLRLQYGRTEMIPPDPKQSASLNRVPQVPMIFLLSNDGAIVRLENWKEVRDGAVALVRSTLQESGMPSEEINATLKKTQGMYATQAQTTMMMTRDIAMYFYPIGIDIAAGEPLDTVGSIENPFGGEPFPTRTRLMAKPIANGKHQYRVTLETKFDAEPCARILLDSISQFAKKGAPRAELPSRFDIEDHSEFVFDAERGWVVQGSHERKSVVNELRRLDRWEWKLDPTS